MIDVTVHTITWNEEYMLPFFIKHYSFAKKIIIHDNESTDNTEDIALTYDNVEVESYVSNDQQDNLTMVKVKNNCWKNDDTEWSIVCDVDEFLIIDWDKIATYPKPIAFKALGVQMVGSGEPLEEINKGILVSLMNKIVLFSSCIEETNYAPGCHVAEPTCPVAQETELRHYSMLSEDYVVERYQRYVPRMSESDVHHNFGRHYLRPERYTRRRYRQLRKMSQTVKSLKELYG